jgi:hypothetical protein
MKLEVTEEYFDIEQETLKEPGDILNVSEERGKTLLAARVCVAVQGEPEAEKPAAKKPARKTTKK